MISISTATSVIAVPLASPNSENIYVKAQGGYTLGYHTFSENGHAKGYSFGGSVGYTVTPNMRADISVSYNNIETNKDSLGAIDQNKSLRGTLNLALDFMPESNFSPFVTAGVGTQSNTFIKKLAQIDELFLLDNNNHAKNNIVIYTNNTVLSLLTLNTNGEIDFPIKSDQKDALNANLLKSAEHNNDYGTLAYNVGIGASYKVNNQFVIEISYLSENIPSYTGWTRGVGYKWSVPKGGDKMKRVDIDFQDWLTVRNYAMQHSLIVGFRFQL